MRTGSTDKIRAAFERNARAVELRPARGQGTATTRVRVRDGLTCDIEEGPWHLTVDMGEKSGGNNAGPNPGILGRGALGSCLAIGYMQWAALFGVPLDEVAVDVEADYDARGIYGLDDTPPAYRQIRCKVSIISSAPEADVVRVLEAAEAHSPYWNLFAREQDVRRESHIQKPAE